MNKTQYDDWLVKFLDKIEHLVIKLDKYKKAFIKKFNKKLSDKEMKQKIQQGILGYSKRIQNASSTPRGNYGPRYKYIKFTLTDEYEQMLMKDATLLDIYFFDYSYLDLSDKTFYIRGKSASQRFLLSDKDLPYRDTHNINKYLSSHEAFDNKFYVEEISPSEWKSIPDNKKIKLVKEI